MHLNAHSIYQQFFEVALNHWSHGFCNVFQTWHLFLFHSHWLHPCQMAMIEKAKPKEPETAEVDNDEGEDLNAIRCQQFSDCVDRISQHWSTRFWKITTNQLKMYVIFVGGSRPPYHTLLGIQVPWQKICLFRFGAASFSGKSYFLVDPTVLQTTQFALT